MAVFRVEKKRDYTVMSNYHLRDKTLSLKAKGLLSLMLSLPENWDYTLAGLVTICREEIGAVSSGIKELEAHGYLERITVRNDKGQFQDTDYMIYEIPQKTPEEIIDLKSAKKETAAKSDNPKSTEPSMNGPIQDKPISKNPLSDKSLQLNTNIQNTKRQNTDFINYPSINPTESSENSNSQITEEIRWIDRYSKNEDFVKKNIDYQTLCYYHDKNLVDNIVNIMTEVLTVDKPYYCIEGDNQAGVLVQQQFRKVDYAKIESFLLHFEQRTGKINSMKSYLITSLYNVPSTAAAQLQNTVAYDMYGCNEERRIV